MGKGKNHKKTCKGSRGNRKNPHANLGMQVQVPQLRVRLPYFYNGTLTEAAAGLGIFYTFAINSVFDPDFTGGGLQPLGLDQYAQFYGRYRVTSSRAIVEFSSRTGSPIIVGAYFSPQSTLPAAPNSWPVVNKSAVSKLIAANSGGLSTASFQMRQALPDLFGVTRSEFLNEMDFAALNTNSPVRQGYLHVFTIGRAGVSVTDFAIRLYFDVEFSQPVSLSLS